MAVSPQAPPFEADQAAMFAFYGRLMDDMAGAMVAILCAAGDRLGLFDALAQGPATADELAERAGADPRYVRDWLGSLASREYLDRDPDTGAYSIPAAHAPALAQEGGPFFLGGAFQQLPGLTAAYDRVLDAFRAGRGVPADEYGEQMRSAMERTSAGWFDHQLVPEWIGAMPELRARLEEGAAVADIGCGAGRAVVALASAFERSRVVGLDLSAPALERARSRAATAGVQDRVHFEVYDVTQGLPGSYDLVTMFDVLHDIAQPVDVLRAVRGALRDGGTFLLLEMNAAEQGEDNRGPIGTLLYATSVLYCLPTSIASGAEGLGTLGLPESRVRAMCAEAGFAEVRRLPIANPFHALYQVTR